MAQHGTALQMEVGQFAEFVAAIVRQLPREISRNRAQELIQNQKELAQILRLAFLPDPQDECMIRDSWQDFYGRVLGMEVDFSEVGIPKHVSGFDRVIFIAKGLLISKALAACKFSWWCYWDNPDSAIIKNERSATDAAYAIRVRDRVEADEELESLSAEDISGCGIATETALERVIHELKYHHETGDHLDRENITLCGGSRDSDGYVPYARWYGDKFRLPCFHPQYADSHLRARKVVTL